MLWPCVVRPLVGEAALCLLLAVLAGCQADDGNTTPAKGEKTTTAVPSASEVELEPIVVRDHREQRLLAEGYRRVYSFTGTVEKTDYLSRELETDREGRIVGLKVSYDGQGMTLVDGVDPRFVLLVRDVKDVEGRVPLRKDGYLAFGIHSPVRFFIGSGVRGSTDGARLSFVMYEKPLEGRERPSRQLVARWLPPAALSAEEGDARYRDLVDVGRPPLGHGDDWTQFAIFTGRIERLAAIELDIVTGKVRSTQYEGTPILMDGVLSSHVVVVGNVTSIEGRPPLNSDGKFAFAIHSPPMFFRYKLNLSSDHVIGKRCTFMLYRRRAEGGKGIDYRVDLAMKGGAERKAGFFLPIPGDSWQTPREPDDPGELPPRRTPKDPLQGDPGGPPPGEFFMP